MAAPIDRSFSSQSARFYGRLSVLAAAILWSSSGLFAKAAVFDDWSGTTRGTQMAFWRALFAAMVLLPTIAAHAGDPCSFRWSSPLR